MTLVETGSTKPSVGELCQQFVHGLLILHRQDMKQGVYQ